jgi:menaquinone-specific isochorismate synthase
MSHLPLTRRAEDAAVRPRESLQRRLEAARVDSQGAPEDIILVKVDAPLVRPEALLQCFPELDCILWSPPEGARFAGIGVAHAITGSGAARFAEVTRRSAELFGRIRASGSQRGSGDTPRLFGGFAFSADGAASGAWSAFGAARFVLPRVGYLEVGKQATLTLAIERSELERGPSSDSVQLFHRVYAAVLAQPQPAPSQRPEALSRVEPEAATFQERVLDLLGRITGGELRKVVTAREVQLTFASHLDAVATVIALREQAPECLRFLFRWGGVAFIGATPERLLHKRERWLDTEALAGSIDAGADNPEDRLRASPKELEEHQFVVAAITRALEPVCDPPNLPARPGVRALKHLLHLCTPIQAKLHADMHVLELLERLHPTPAVAGVPTRAALDWIVEHESFDRGWYSGAVGWFDAKGDGDFNVALRSGLIRGNQAWLYAGAGIVRESTAAAEYEETTLKLAAVLASLRARP